VMFKQIPITTEVLTQKYYNSISTTYFLEVTYIEILL